MATETELERLVVRLVGDAASYQKMLADVQKSTARAGEEVKRQTDAVKVFGETIGRLGTEMSTMAAGFAAFDVIGRPQQWLQSAVMLAASAEDMQVSFEAMLGNASKAAEMVKDIQDFAAQTPLSQEGLQAATKMLLQFGIAGERIIPTLKMLGDAAGGDQERLMRLARGFGQASSSGRLMGEDLNQLIDAGFNPLQEISRKTGRTMVELRADMEKGKISVDMLTEAFRSYSERTGGMEKAAGTLKGVWSTMKDDLDAFLRTVGVDIVERFGIKDLIKGVSETAKALVEWYGNLSGATKSLVTNTAIFLVGFVALTKAWVIGSKVVGFLIGGLAHMVVSFKAVIGAVVAATTATWAWVSSLTAAKIQAALVATGMKFHAAVMAVATAMKAATAATWAFVTSAKTLRTVLMLLGASLALVAIGAAVYGLGRLVVNLSGASAEADRLAEAIGRADRAAEKYLETISSATAADIEKATGKFESGDREGARADLEKRKAALENLLSAAQKGMADTRAEIARMQDDLGETIVRSTFGLVIETPEERRLEQARADLEKYRAEVERLKKELGVVKDAAGKMADPAADPATVKAVKELTEKLALQVQTLGMSSAEADLYKLKLMGASEAQLANARGLAAMHEELTKTKKAADDAARALEKAFMDAGKWVEDLADELAGVTSEEKKFRELAEAGAPPELLGLIASLTEAVRAKKELDGLMAEGKRVTDEFRTPQEKFNDRVAELDKLLNVGAISMETYNRAVAGAREQLQGAAGAASMLHREVGRVDAVLANSAEAKSRVMRFREAMMAQNVAVAQNPRVSAGPGFNAQNFAAHQGPVVELLQNIAQNTGKSAKKDPLVIKTTDPARP